MQQTRLLSSHRSLILLTLLCVFVLCPLLSAQDWVKNYGVEGQSWQGRRIQNMPGGGFALAGQTDNNCSTLLSRLDSEGDTLWTRKFSSPGAWTNKKPTDLQVGPDGKIHCVMMDFYDWWCTYVCLDGAGHLVAAFPVFEGPNYDYLVSFSLVDDGIVFAGAVSESDSTRLIKRSFDGVLEWSRSLPLPGGVVAMEQTPEGEFVLLVETANYDYEVVKTDGNGQFLWRAPEDTYTYRGDIAVQPNGDIVYVSEAISPGDIYFLKLSPDGAVLDIVLDSIFPGKENPVGNLLSDAAGNLYLTGSVWMNEDGEDHELLLARYDPDLQRTGIQTFDYAETFWEGRDIILTDDGSLVICGTRSIQAEFSGSFFTAWMTILKIQTDVLSGVKTIAAQPTQLLMVQPNPFTDQVLFNFQESDGTLKTIGLYNPEGRLLTAQSFEGSSFQLEAGDLPVGVLFYQVKEEGKRIAAGKLVHVGN